MSIDFKRRMDRCSPIKMGIVSLPTMRSPCMPRMSKKAVLTNTRHVAQIKTKSVLTAMVFNNAIAGIIAVTSPQANAISTVFDPGMSLILRYFPVLSHFGINRI